MLNRLRTNSLLTLVCSLLLGFPFNGFCQIEINEGAREAKLAPDLLKLEINDKQTLQRRGNLRQAASDDDLTNPRQNLMRIRDGRVAIEAISNQADAQSLLGELQALGLTDGSYFKRIVSGYFPISELGKLKNVSTLHMARPAYKPLRQVGKVTSQGDIALRADIARQTYNVTGAGSKIGILSDSYNARKGAADGVASGDLPANVQVIKDYIEDGAEDEGRGMAEIVHDVAPGANIAFHTAFESYVDFALGIVRLGVAGCNIIVDDVYYPLEPFFQEGIISQAISYVKEKGNVSYFSSAGNHAANSYSSPFRNSGKLPSGARKGSAHDFGNGVILQKASVAPGSTMLLVLQWSDPFYSEGAVDFSKGIWDYGILGAKTDLDIYVYQKGVLMPNYSIVGYNNIGDDPIDYVYIPNNTKETIEIELAIVKVDGPDPTLIKLVNFNNGDPGVRADFATNGSTVVGHANAANAIAVGAAGYYATPAFNPTLQAPIIQSYSSAGGTPILFTEYGQPIPPIVRQKPEIVAPDGGNTTFFYLPSSVDGDAFPNFFGTSAAAPHAAAVAALLQEKAKLSMSPADILKRLESTAIDMDNPLTPGFDVGFDFRTGYGFIQADKALTFGEPLTVLEPIYDCATGRITLQTAGGDGTPITFSTPGIIRTSPTSTTGIVEAGVRNDPKPVVIVATQSGVSVTYLFNIVEYCSRPRVLTLIEPLYDCATGRITIRTMGGDGTPITYTIPGVTRSSLTDPTGIVEAGLRNDPKPLMITAIQSGVTVTYVFNFGAYCSGRARVAAGEAGSGLQVTTLGNPIITDWVDVEVRGVEGQPLKFQVNNTLGELTTLKAVDMAESVERHKVLLGRTPGMYFLKVSTPAQTKTIKVIRQ